VAPRWGNELPCGRGRGTRARSGRRLEDRGERVRLSEGGGEGSRKSLGSLNHQGRHLSQLRQGSTFQTEKKGSRDSGVGSEGKEQEGSAFRWATRAARKEENARGGRGLRGT